MSSKTTFHPAPDTKREGMKEIMPHDGPPGTMAAQTAFALDGTGKMGGENKVGFGVYFTSHLF